MSVSPFLFFVCSSHFSCLFVVHSSISMSLDVFLSISHPSIMVRGSGDEPGISGKPDYDGTLKDWAFAKNIEAGTQQSQSSSSFIGAGTQQSQFITPTAHEDGRRESPSSDPSGTTSIGAGTKPSQFITPTAHQDGRRNSSTTASAQEYLEDLDITSSSTTTPSSPCSLRRELHKTKAAQEPNHN